MSGIDVELFVIATQEVFSCGDLVTWNKPLNLAALPMPGDTITVPQDRAEDKRFRVIRREFRAFDLPLLHVREETST